MTAVAATATALPPIALTMGDPSGIAAEISVKAWAALKDGGPPFFVIADEGVMAAEAASQGLQTVAIAGADEAEAAMPAGLPVLPHPLPAMPVPGRPDPANAKAIVTAIERAVAIASTGRAAAVVTNPINKKGLKEGAGFAFPGHTEFLAHLGGVPRAVMMLAGPGLRVVPVTIHVPLAEVSRLLTRELIVETVAVLNAALVADFGIAAPRIAVAGLNPHAGEGGAMGREEETVIAPALAELRGCGIAVTGPLPADTMFHPAARARYDAAVCMYHDQALIPLKALHFDDGVNVTLGLPFVRTSPDHGTAYDIAGKGKADPSSLIAAIRMAAGIAARRAA